MGNLIFETLLPDAYWDHFLSIDNNNQIITLSGDFLFKGHGTGNIRLQ